MWLAPLVALALAAGDPPDAAPAPAAAPDAAAPAEVAAEPAKPTRLPGLRPTRLPDGTYEGVLEGPLDKAKLELTIVNGFMTRGVVRLPSGDLPLRPTFTPSDLGLRLGGRGEANFVRLSGGFWDTERAAGRFEGTVEKKRVQGTWRLARR